MSQHDMDIANATHSSVRADLNAALVALVGQNSGATAPATTFAYQFWADTTTGILKQRNAANSAWISVLTLSTGLSVGNAVLAGDAAQDFAAKILTLGNLLKMKTGADIASAATINLSTATGNLVHITGTTATSAVTMAAGQWMMCIADAAWPLTYHATTNKISGGASYTLSAGDAVLYTYDGTTVRGHILRADGRGIGEDGKTTVASAATPNIFAATVGPLVDYTGTATCTGFVAAPKAGATRRLICAGACLFTAGANLLIEGIPSGTTITLAANALVDVTAITTTQFKMTYSVSGTFTATGTGFTVNPTATARYSVVNGRAHISIPGAVLYGTSNATTFTITGLPNCLNVATRVYFPIGDGLDNGTAAHVSAYINGATIFLYKEHHAGVWTSSGTKQLVFGEFDYLLN